MPGPNQRYKGLLAFYVDKEGVCEVTLGQYFDSINPDNSETQWIHPIRALISSFAKMFLKSKGLIK